jgi:uncharacterized integral membrane protein
MDGKYVMILIALVLLAIFLIQNSSAMIIKFLGFSFRTSAAVMILLAAVLGIIIGSVMTHRQNKPKPRKK